MDWVDLLDTPRFERRRILVVSGLRPFTTRMRAFSAPKVYGRRHVPGPAAVDLRTGDHDKTSRHFAFRRGVREQSVEATKAVGAMLAVTTEREADMDTTGVERLVGAGEAALPARIASAVRDHADGVSRAILFGSVARGEERPDSDVDLLLVWPDNTDDDARWDISMRVAQIVDDVAGRVCIPLVYTHNEYEHLSSGLAGSLDRDGIDLLTYGV